MLDEDSIVYLHKIDSEYNLRMYSRIGRRRPLYSTGFGKVMMAWLPETEVRAMLAGVTFERFTEHTLADVDALLVELAQVREQGYAEDREEMDHGLRCFAVPIYSRMGRIIAGLSLSLPLVRFHEEDKASLVAQLHETAARISTGLGFAYIGFEVLEATTDGLDLGDVIRGLDDVDADDVTPVSGKPSALAQICVTTDGDGDLTFRSNESRVMLLPLSHGPVWHLVSRTSRHLGGS